MSFLGRVEGNSRYTIVAVEKGKRKGVEIAAFPTHDEMTQAWLRVTDLYNMVDVIGAKFD